MIPGNSFLIGFIIGTVMSAFGAFCITWLAFRKVWKNKVTRLELTGFTFTFFVCFVVIGIVMSVFFMQPSGKQSTTSKQPGMIGRE